MTTKPAFGPRWLITGRLRLTSELHLGTGESRPDDALRGPRMTEDETPDIALVAGSDTGRPYIPGTSLKGALRAWINRHLAQLAPDGLITDDWQKDVFGHVTTRSDRSGEEDDGLGGRVIIGDAEVSATQTIQPAREARIAIDPRTRTVDGRRLFHQQTLPPGTVFNIRVVIETPPAEDGRQLVPSAEIAQALLTAFNGFDTGPEETRIRLGADKGMGKGAAVFELGEVRCYDAEVVRAWIAAGATESWDRSDVAATAARRSAAAQLDHEAASWVPVSDLATTPWSVIIDLDLQVTTRLMATDPEATRLQAERRARGEEEGPLTRETRRDPEGRPVLLATSLKGALRARAMRILTTLFAGDHTSHRLPDGAAQVAKDVFGSTGRRSRLRIGPMRPTAEPVFAIQEFIALDRFSGGGATGRKFRSRAAEAPGWDVPLILDLDGLSPTRRDAAFALVVLVLKDLIDGDMSVGHGTAHGYGRTGGSLRGLRIGGSLAAEDGWQDLALTDGAARDPFTAEMFRLFVTRQALPALRASGGDRSAPVVKGA
ncbi:RAMP superfamily CRISPR-associated protein (plasmid) [Tistrella mobilis]|uniref:RAMP superfamily CRISPR-associated protein n=1 Tax=Tistrella mobilis TaxID=171437 RepID=UPI003556D5F2